MNLSLSTLPASIDMLHLGLAILALIFMSLLFIKKRSLSIQQESSHEQPVATDVKPVQLPVQLRESTPDAALQLLALLQQEARLIDFTREDLTGFSDADVGAAARVVHEGSKKH